MRITSLYAALCALLIVVLGLRVAYYRFSRKVGVGDNGDRALIKLIRAHGNAVENVPIALLLLLLLELNQTQPAWIHAGGIVLVIGRIAHAIGLSRSTGASLARVIGTLLTWTLILVMAVLLLWQYLVLHPL
jgi:uncharacterized membrane protein YecN with MAPEG domain